LCVWSQKVVHFCPHHLASNKRKAFDVHVTMHRDKFLIIKPTRCTNDPQWAYAQHILNGKHEYGPINNTITLLKHIIKASLSLPYIQTHHQHQQLISEQCTGKHNPIYQLIHDTFLTSLPTRPTDQYPTSNRTKPVPSWSCSQLLANLVCKHRTILYRQNLSHILEYFNILLF
jgi:hypothetical protein